MPGIEPGACQDVRYQDGASDGMYMDLEVSRRVEFPMFLSEAILLSGLTSGGTI
jgi:hypothetical protein